MAKQRGRVPKISKLTGTDGSAVVDFETGILIGVSNDDAALARTSQRDDSSAERFWQPRSNPNPKLSRN
jgi:hypothetical protein